MITPNTKARKRPAMLTYKIVELSDTIKLPADILFTVTGF